MFQEKTRLALFTTILAMVLLLVVGLAGCGKAVTTPRSAGAGKTATPNPEQSGFTTSASLTAIHMFDSEHGWLLNRGLYVTDNGGRDWKKAGPPLVKDDNIREEVVTVASPRTAWVAIGTSPTRGQAWVTLFHTTDGGQSWTKNTMKENLPARNHYKTEGQIPAYLTFSDQEHGWLVTQVPEWDAGGVAPGGLYRTSDGGKSWHFVAFAKDNMGVRFPWLYFLNNVTGFTVEGQQQSNTDTGVIARGSERLYRTTNGGFTWQPSQVPLSVAKYLDLDIEKPVFFNAKDGILPVLIHGSSANWTMYLYVTADAGTTWHPEGKLALSSPMGDNLSYDFLNVQNGWVSCGGKLYVTYDGSKSFTAVETGFTNDMREQIDFINEQQGWLARWAYDLPGAPVALYETRDGGHTWKQLP